MTATTRTPSPAASTGAPANTRSASCPDAGTRGWRRRRATGNLGTAPSTRHTIEETLTGRVRGVQAPVMSATAGQP